MIHNNTKICFKKFEVIFEERPEGTELTIPIEVGSGRVDITSKPFNAKGGCHYKIILGYMVSEPLNDLQIHIHTFKKSMPFGRDVQKIGEVHGNSNNLEFLFPSFGWEQPSSQSSSMGEYTIKMYFKDGKDNELATFFYSFNVTPDWVNVLPTN
ncbi:hypothetical protein DICPUDRAFT_78427 [Dictyostelium purpureum]|uniref:Rho GDP-dissociation inhibitor n=1 Tax=Dictyostelium purpureum TaxID=5786 RepID=F0ZJI6_DICPU|nr:uncharacterized protein DICPUDRAFT_78427 [Dictyostelium purpureum]EGC35927.1 hypothetical protein DICPUDRAFT_78427 [Dictyostelium purpureum]|eukprot:XP_003287581.1 hypothetical protein DICPUDRAFT_78427 [Dictyostelium purpureum]